MKIAVAYCRVSTLQEEQKKSIIEQQKQWKEIAYDKGYTLSKSGVFYKKNGNKELKPGLYVDEGISAKDCKNREAFKQMIEDAKNNKFSTIFVEDVSRFSRNAEIGLKVCKDLREIGVNVFFRKEGINSIDVNGDFLLNHFFAIAEKENQTKSERVKWGISRVHKDGRVNTTPSIGYKMKEGKVRGLLEIDEEKSEVVKYIFYLYTEKGFGMHKIAQILNKRNITTRKGRIWSQNTISVVLNNRIYIGEQITHKSESFDITRGTIKKIPKEEQYINFKEELRIIDDETWNKKEIIMNERKKNIKQHKGHSTRHLLSTLMYCSNCGSTFFRVKQNDYITKSGNINKGKMEWVCMGRNHHGKEFCQGERYTINEEKMLNLIKEEVKTKMKENTELLLDLYKQDKKNRIAQINVKELEDKKHNINLQMIDLREEKNKKLIDEDSYNEQIKELNKRLVEIRVNIKEYENTNKDIEIAEIKYKEYINNLRELSEGKITNEGLKKVFNKIEIKGKMQNNKKTIYVFFDYKFLDGIERVLTQEITETEIIQDKLYVLLDS